MISSSTVVPDVVHHTRHQLDAICILHPADLYALNQSLQAPPDLPPAAPFDAAWVAGLPAAIAAASAGLGPEPAKPTDTAAQDVLQAADPHDAYFRVTRLSSGGMTAFRRSVLQALSIWHGECEGRAVSPSAATVVRALVSLWSVQRDQSASPRAADTDTDTDTDDAPSAAVTADLAVQRWLRGHQIFAVLTQGLILVVQSLERAASRGDGPRVERLLLRIAQLYDASAASMRFTADFPRVHYETLIRPSMSEPRTPAGFSGTLSTDHGHLVRALMSAQAAFTMAASDFPRAHATVKQALTSLYAEHRLVCERLTGVGQPSIRSATLTQERHASGELLDRFHARRSQLLG